MFAIEQVPLVANDDEIARQASAFQWPAAAQPAAAQPAG
jgi:hypothetical protein